MLSNTIYYTLMHKNKEVGLLGIDADDSKITAWKSINQPETPFVGQADLHKLKIWWSSRAVPGSRKMMADMLHKADCQTPLEYLSKNLGLSMTDTYWIRPLGADLTWEDVSLFKKQDITLPYHNAASYDPNASLGGQMEKYWDMSGEAPLLVKTASAHYGQQGLNELFASLLHKAQNIDIPYTSYGIRFLPDNSVQCCCKAFTSENIEFLSAYEILNATPDNNEQSLYDKFISECAKHGLDEQYVRKFLDYQTLTDFIIDNIDEHLNNFGILRDTDTNQWIAPAPIFDSGNSMYYQEYEKAFNRVDHLKQEITGFHHSWEKMLKHITFKDIVQYDNLPDRDQVMQFYTTHKVPEAKAQIIAASYDSRLSLVRDFQHNHAISLYKETHTSQNMERDD